MSAQPPAQNYPQPPGGNDGGSKGRHTRYYTLIMTVLILIAIVIDIAILIAIFMNVEGRVRIPRAIFILPIIAALVIGRLIDAALVKKSPHLVPGYAAQSYQAHPGAVPAQQGYDQPAVQQMTPQSTYSQAPYQQMPPDAPQQAPYGHQQAPYGQYTAAQAPQNQAPYGQGWQPGQAGPTGY